MANTIAFAGLKVHFRSRDGKQVRGRERFLAAIYRFRGAARASCFSPAADLDRGISVSIHSRAGTEIIATKLAPDSTAIVATPELPARHSHLCQFRLVADGFGDVPNSETAFSLRGRRRSISGPAGGRQRRNRSDCAHGQLRFGRGAFHRTISPKNENGPGPGTGRACRATCRSCIATVQRRRDRGWL